MRTSISIYEKGTDNHIDSIQVDLDQIPGLNEEIVIAIRADSSPPQTVRVRKVLWFVFREIDLTGSFDGPAIHAELISD